MIKADARIKFTAEDFDFITGTLARRGGSREALGRLLDDEGILGRILDEEALFEELLTGETLATVSPYLFFYILCRRALRERTIDDPAVADYLSSLLTEFGHEERMYRISELDEVDYTYVVDLLLDLAREADERRAFLLRSHIGNYALFLAGLFPDYISYRSTYRSHPGLDYYETMGSTAYASAAGHDLAREHGLETILNEIADRFSVVRYALNRMVDEYLALGTGGESVDRMVRRILYTPHRHREN